MGLGWVPDYANGGRGGGGVDGCHISALHVLPLRRLLLVGTHDGQIKACI